MPIGFYLQGVFVEALLKGHWILLDEINLASTEILECLLGVVDMPRIFLSDRGLDYIF